MKLKVNPTIGGSRTRYKSIKKGLGEQMKWDNAVPVRLTRNYVTFVDKQDYAAVSQFVWHTQIAKHTAYARRFYTVGGKTITQGLHQFILGCKRVDHRDRDGLNNQRYNLRPATIQQNACNKIKTHGVSQYKGVCRNRKMWRAMIRIDKKKTHIGNF